MADPFESRLRVVQMNVGRRQGRRDEISASLERERAAALEHDRQAELAQKAAELLQAAIQARREELRDRVELLVTRGLRSIFGRADFRFFFETTFRGMSISISPALLCRFGGQEIQVGIVDGHGGGVADVISFLLRVVVLCMARPRLAPFLVCDEPFRHVSLEYQRGCASLIRELNRSAGIQFLIVTHKPDLLDAADLVYRTAVDGQGVTTFVLEHEARDDSYHAAPPAGSPTGPAAPTQFETEPAWKAIGAATHGKSPGQGISEKGPLAAAIPTIVPVDDELSRKQQGPRYIEDVENTERRMKAVRAGIQRAKRERRHPGKSSVAVPQRSEEDPS